MKNVEIICNGCEQPIVERFYVTVSENEQPEMHFHTIGCLAQWIKRWRCPICRGTKKMSSTAQLGPARKVPCSYCSRELNSLEPKRTR